MRELKDELQAITAVPVLGPIWANALGVWLALTDARNMISTRFDGGSDAEQRTAIERVLASRPSAQAQHSAGTVNLRAAA